MVIKSLRLILIIVIARSIVVVIKVVVSIIITIIIIIITIVITIIVPIVVLIWICSIALVSDIRMEASSPIGCICHYLYSTVRKLYTVFTSHCFTIARLTSTKIISRG